MKILNEKGLAYFATSGTPADKEGYLQKKGEVHKTFQKRWFVLKGNLFFYYEKKGDVEPAGVIVLEGCTIQPVEDVRNFTFVINFSAPGSRSYYLCTHSLEAKESWMKALSCAGITYMKLMVSELQSKLEEVSTVGINLIRSADRDGQLLGQVYGTFTDITSSLDEAYARRETRALTLPLTGKPHAVSSKTKKCSGESDQCDAFHPVSKIPKIEILTWPVLGIQSFTEMHKFVEQQINTYKVEAVELMH